MGPSEDDSDDGEPIGPEEAPPAPRHHRRGSSAGGVRKWKGSDGESEGEEGTQEDRRAHVRFRDSVWFEPAVALVVIVVLIAGLYGYTQNWPPVYVIESMSMQHGDGDTVGDINTGDLVLAQKAGSITDYLAGMKSGYETYGEYGDVLLYEPLGQSGVTPVIHRSIIYLQADSGNLWSSPDLSGLTCTNTSHPYYRVSSTKSGCGSTGFSGELTLYNIGWQSVEVDIPLGQLNHVSGYLTMGDNNYIPGTPNSGEPDQFSQICPDALVQSGWIVGVARGMIPWFGAIKLYLEGDASMVPPASWEYLGLTVAGFVLLGLFVHILLERRRGGPGGEEEESAPSKRSGPGSETSEDNDGDGESPSPRSHAHPLSKEKLLRCHSPKGGRPRPAVRRKRTQAPSDS